MEAVIVLVESFRAFDSESILAEKRSVSGRKKSSLVWTAGRQVKISRDESILSITKMEECKITVEQKLKMMCFLFGPRTASFFTLSSNFDSFTSKQRVALFVCLLFILVYVPVNLYCGIGFCKESKMVQLASTIYPNAMLVSSFAVLIEAVGAICQVLTMKGNTSTEEALFYLLFKYFAGDDLLLGQSEMGKKYGAKRLHCLIWSCTLPVALLWLYHAGFEFSDIGRWHSSIYWVILSLLQIPFFFFGGRYADIHATQFSIACTMQLILTLLG